MKAKYFKKLREKSDWYDVEVTKGLFGEFLGFDKEGFRQSDYITVLATSYENACLRACRRGYGRIHFGMFNVSPQNWARFAVKLTKKNNHWRNIAYRGN